MTDHEQYSQQVLYEQELDKIRTEGDLALVRAQSEHQELLKAEEELRSLQKQLKEKKKEFAKITATNGAVGDLATLEHINKRHIQAQKQQEDRLKASASAKTTELQALKQEIEELRQRRVHGLHAENRIVEKTKLVEEGIKQTQCEVEALKEKSAEYREKLTQLQAAFEAEENLLRHEKQQLQLQLDRIVHPERVGLKVNVNGRKFNVYHSISTSRKKRDARSRAKKLSLEEKTISFEQKKMLLDRCLDETGVSNLRDFVEMYNQQEKEKAEIMERIERASFENTSLSEAITHLEVDITRLSGAGDLKSIVESEQPTELKKRIDSDEELITQWKNDSHAFLEMLKAFREPIHELYLELFPDEKDDKTFESTIKEISMLRHIGSIEERVMQHILMKILTETDATGTSETLKRLRRYRAGGNVAIKNETLDVPNETSSRSNPIVSAPSIYEDLQNMLDEDFNDEQVVAIRSEDIRPKKQTPSPSTALNDSKRNEIQSTSPDNHRLSVSSVLPYRRNGSITQLPVVVSPRRKTNVDL